MAHEAKAFDLFIKTYAGKYPKVTQCLLEDQLELLMFYDFPAAHCKAFEQPTPSSLPLPPSGIGSNDSEVVCRDTMLHMMFKLGLCAEKRWRRLRYFDYFVKVITGIKFNDGIVVKEASQNSV